MKTFFYLTIWREAGTPALFNELLKLCPNGFSETDMTFKCEFALPDERDTQILSILQAAGFQPRRYYIPRGSHQYTLIYRRQYDESDWEPIEWFQPITHADFEQVLKNRRSDGILEIEPRFFKRPIILDGSGEDSLVISKQVRVWLQESGLRGMVFRPTAKVKGRGAADETNLWELTTEAVLPPMSSKMTFLDALGNPTQAGQEGGFSRVESFFIPVEYHYTRSAIQQAQGCDFALTWEHFGMPKGHLPEILVSKRFYDVCITHNLKMDWIPVRIDPD